MRTPHKIEELKDYPFREVIRHNFEDEQLSFDAPVLGKGNTAIIPLAHNIMLAYFSGIPEATYKMRYSHYYQDRILLSICMTGAVSHEIEDEPFVSVHAGETFMYEVNRDQTYFEVQAGKRFEMATIVIGGRNFQNVWIVFFEKEQQEERRECINAIFSGARKGKVFDISKRDQADRSGRSWAVACATITAVSSWNVSYTRSWLTTCKALASNLPGRSAFRRKTSANSRR